MCRRAKGVWRSFFPEVELCGCFMAKVDVSEVKMEDLQEVLPMPESLLKTRGKKYTRWTRDRTFLEPWTGRPSSLLYVQCKGLFCPEPIGFPRQSCLYSGPHIQHFRTCLDFAADLSKWLYDKDQNLQQSGIPVQGWRGVGQFQRVHCGGYLFFEQVPPKSACTPGCPEKGLHSGGGVSICVPGKRAFYQNSRKAGPEHLGLDIPRRERLVCSAVPGRDRSIWCGVHTETDRVHGLRKPTF